MAAKRCPNCQLVNPGSAQSCDCGYSFADGSIGRPLDLAKPGVPGQDTYSAPGQSSAGSNLAMRVLVWIIVVAVVTAIKIAIRSS